MNIPEKFVVLESVQKRLCQVQGIFDTREEAVTFIVASLDQYGEDKRSLTNHFTNRNIFTDSITGVSYIIRNGPYYSRKRC